MTKSITERSVRKRCTLFIHYTGKASYPIFPPEIAIFSRLLYHAIVLHFIYTRFFAVSIQLSSNNVLFSRTSSLPGTGSFLWQEILSSCPHASEREFR
ncbi:MAG TPA: hypothetical protein VFN35_27170, partial [Ktedonobacteraceae bacterium]|nr:hypothetical protein [Ktedonobacteraceae bacterium]